jgi:hypothetical protein
MLYNPETFGAGHYTTRLLEELVVYKLNKAAAEARLHIPALLPFVAQTSSEKL